MIPILAIIIPGLFNGFGGLNTNTITDTLDDLDITEKQYRQWIRRQVFVAADAIRKLEEAERGR